MKTAEEIRAAAKAIVDFVQSGECPAMDVVPLMATVSGLGWVLEEVYGNPETECPVAFILKEIQAHNRVN